MNELRKLVTDNVMEFYKDLHKEKQNIKELNKKEGEIKKSSADPIEEKEKRASISYKEPRRQESVEDGGD